jgi:predicted HAD superfamily Cof-like phosphohydrolase
MKSQLKAVENFHVTFGQKINSYPTLLNEDEYLLRHRLMEEENSEYKEACENQSIVGIADALGDQLYILCGTILKHGLQHVIEDVFDEIQASNMSKLGPDGKPLLREDGKILKGEGYRPPNIGKFL